MNLLWFFKIVVLKKVSSQIEDSNVHDGAGVKK